MIWGSWEFICIPEEHLGTTAETLGTLGECPSLLHAQTPGRAVVSLVPALLVTFGAAAVRSWGN